MITTHHGDCVTILPTLPAGSVQSVITSPPYYALRDYQIPPTAWPEIAYAPMAGVPPVTIPAVECCLGLEDSPLAYVAHLVHVARLIWSVLRDDGVLWMNIGDSYAQPSKWGGRSGNKNRSSEAGRYPRRRLRADSGLKDKDLFGVPWRVALALQADGWTLRAEIIWEKPTAMPESVSDRPTRSHEQLFLFSKQESYFYDAAAIAEPTTGGAHHRGNGVHPKAAAAERGARQNASFSACVSAPVSSRNARTIWRIPAESYDGQHYATFPRRLVGRCVLASTSPRACEHCNAPWRRSIAESPITDSRKSTDAPIGYRLSAIGYEPSCHCADNLGIGRCTVLDPFAGTGTTAAVAEGLGRDSVLIELNADYIKLQERRTNGVQLASTELLA